MILITWGCLMFFKATFITLGFSALLLFLSCSNDHKFKNEEPIVSLSYDSDCLSELSTTVDLYIDELLSDAEIKRNFSCVIEALDYVQVRVKGETQGVYTPTEVQNFLNKFLFKTNKKELNFFTSLFFLKKQIFGGSEKSLTFTDLKILKDFLLEAEVLALTVKPYASELFFKKAFKTDNISIVVRPVAQFLERWVLYQKNGFSIQSVLDFLEKAEIEIKAPESFSAVFNLLRSVEAQSLEVKYDDKLNFVNTLESYYVQSLDLYKSFDSNLEYERSEFFDFSSKIDVLLISVLNTIKKHPKSYWSLSDLTHFMKLVSVYDLLGEKISKGVQEHLVHVLFEKYFANSVKEETLNAENFQKIILAWADIGKFLIEAEELEGHKGKSFPFVKAGSGAFAVFTQRKWPSLVGENRTILIPDYAPEVEFTFQSLLHRSWQFLAAKILIQTYSDDSQGFGEDTGLTLEQVEEAYIDVFILLKEIDFLDEESRGGWFRIFNEGNIFIPSAVPNAYVSYSEAADYAAYMFSAYFAGDETMKYMDTKCPGGEEECSFNYVLQEPESVFRSLPGLWDYLSPDMPTKSYLRWQDGFEYIAKLVRDDKPYKKANWFRGAVASQYIEVIYRKYDLDGSDTLSFEEVSLAYIYFKEALNILPMVKGTSAENDDAKLKSFLTLFVKDGKVPKLRNGRPRGGLVKHVLLCGNVYTSTNKVCTFESDRAKMMSLLAFLTSVSASN